MQDWTNSVVVLVLQQYVKLPLGDDYYQYHLVVSTRKKQIPLKRELVVCRYLQSYRFRDHYYFYSAIIPSYYYTSLLVVVVLILATTSRTSTSSSSTSSSPPNRKYLHFSYADEYFLTLVLYVLYRYYFTGNPGIHRGALFTDVVLTISFATTMTHAI